MLLTAFVYPGKIEVLWYMLFSLIYFVVAAFNGYALYRFGGKVATYQRLKPTINPRQR